MLGIIYFTPKLLVIYSSYFKKLIVECIQVSAYIHISALILLMCFLTVKAEDILVCKNWFIASILHEHFKRTKIESIIWMSTQIGDKHLSYLCYLLILSHTTVGDTYDLFRELLTLEVLNSDVQLKLSSSFTYVLCLNNSES